MLNLIKNQSLQIGLETFSFVSYHNRTHKKTQLMSCFSYDLFEQTKMFIVSGEKDGHF